MDDMIELAVRSFQGNTTPAEEERLRRWRTESLRNEREYRRLRDLWMLTGGAVHRAEPGHVPDARSLIDLADAHESVGTGPRLVADQHPPAALVPASAHRSRWFVRGLRAAAVAGILIPAGVAVGMLLGRNEPTAIVAVNEIITGEGELATVTLDDGSTVRLGSSSRLRIGHEDGGVVAYLDGRAFFGVQADSSRTFTVRTPLGEAVVLGTRFEVRSEDDEFRVLVVEGSVQVATDGSESRLTQGEMKSAVAGGPPTISVVDDIHLQLAWMHNSLVFNATRIDQALAEIEQLYGVTAVIEAPGLAELTVTATFVDQTVDEVVLVLCEVIRARCSVSNDTVRIGAADAFRGQAVQRLLAP